MRASNFVDITDQKFGLLTARYVVRISADRKAIWMCECDCGRTSYVTGKNLRSGNTKSCECVKHKPSLNLKNLATREFGRLTVSHRCGTERGSALWLCLCSCGEKIKVSSDRLLRGKTKSCGCLQKEIAIRNIRKFIGLRGKKSQSWKPNLDRSLVSRRRNLDPRFSAWTARVYRRDNWTCQVTGLKGKIHAHHLAAWSRSKSLRYVTKNGIVLLDWVHRLFHQFYGRDSNTPAQFEEFRNIFKETLLTV